MKPQRVILKVGVKPETQILDSSFPKPKVEPTFRIFKVWKLEIRKLSFRFQVSPYRKDEPVRAESLFRVALQFDWKLTIS